MSVRLSVRPSADKVSGTFWKTMGLIHFIPGIYPYEVSLLTPIHFRVPSLFGPLLAKYLAENGVYGTFWKNYWPNSFHTWHLPLLSDYLDPFSFSCSLPHFRPSGDQIFGQKWGFRNLLKKLLAQFISYLAFILMGWVSWPVYIFLFIASFSGPLVAKYLAENGVSGIFFLKLLLPFITYLAFTLRGILQFSIQFNSIQFMIFLTVLKINSILWLAITCHVRSSGCLVE